MDSFDFIIAGGGAAGLSLAYYLSKSGLKNKRVLIIDKDKKNQNDRTWGFWHNKPTPFGEIVGFRFNRLDFYSRYFQKNIDLGNYHYSVIQGIDFYRFIKKHLESCPNFKFLNAVVSGFNESDDGVEVNTNQGGFFTRWAFNSIYDEKEILKAVSSKLYLRQHFKGWVIKSKNESFDTESFTMFDFRTDQHGLMRFFYVIPQSKHQALVEYTLFSKDLLEPPEYDEAIEKYIDEVLQIKSYETVETEFGVIPMTDYRFPSKQGKYVINIGSLGGASKPSSGYTFTRIQKHTRAIVEALEKGQNPAVSANSKARYRFYDSVLLNILNTRGGLAEKLFSYMFNNNSINQLFQFLDEQGGLANDLKIITSLPPLPFIKSTTQLLFSRH